MFLANTEHFVVAHGQHQGGISTATSKLGLYWGTKAVRGGRQTLFSPQCVSVSQPVTWHTWFGVAHVISCGEPILL